jgi:CRP/FNR family transcriptional regulator
MSQMRPAVQIRELLDGLEAETYAELERLPAQHVPAGAVLFRAGEAATGFVLVLEGSISVSLTGPNGREIELYAVDPGETCVQTTLCLLGEQVYSAEALARTVVRFLVVPRGQFARLLEQSAGFRTFVFRALGTRLADVTTVLEKVAFVRIEARLAVELLRRADAAGLVQATHQDLASSIGSAREVVSRRLEALARQGLVELERGIVRVPDRDRLQRFSEAV